MFNPAKLTFFETIIFILLILGPPRPRTFSALEADGIKFDNYYLIEILSVLFALILIMINLVFRKKFCSIFKRFIFSSKAISLYFSFLLFALLSFSYSYFPTLTIFFSIKSLSFLSLGIILALKRINDIFFIPKLAIFASAIMFAIQALLFIYEPSIVGVYNYNFGYRLTGGWLGGYGIYFAVIVLYLLYLLSIKKNKTVIFILLILALFFLYLSKTRQYYFLIIIAMGILILSSRQAFIKFVLIIFLILFFEHFTSNLFASTLIRDQESFINLSERLVLISVFYNSANFFTLFGGGYYAASKYWLELFGFAQIGIGAAHESISAIFIELGIIGALILSLCLVFLYKSLFNTLSKNITQKKIIVLLKIYLSVLIFLSISLILNVNIIYANFLWIIVLIGAEIAAFYLKNNGIENVKLYRK